MQRIKDIDTLLYPYVVFETIQFVYTLFTGYGYGSPNIFNPTYADWYIMALFIWRTILPYMTLFGKKRIFFIMFLVAGYAGFFHTNYLTLYRVFYFFPIFLIGFYCENLSDIIKRLYKYRYIMLLIFIISEFSIFYISHESAEINYIIHMAFAPDTGYEHNIELLFAKVFLYPVSIAMTLCFFVLSYWLLNGKRCFASMGRNSMSIYIVHGMIILTITPLFIEKLPIQWAIPISIAISIIICIILKSSLVVRTLKPLLDFSLIRSKF